MVPSNQEFYFLMQDMHEMKEQIKELREQNQELRKQLFAGNNQSVENSMTIIASPGPLTSVSDSLEESSSEIKS